MDRGSHTCLYYASALLQITSYEVISTRLTTLMSALALDSDLSPHRLSISVESRALKSASCNMTRGLQTERERRGFKFHPRLIAFYHCLNVSTSRLQGEVVKWPNIPLHSMSLNNLNVNYTLVNTNSGSDEGNRCHSQLEGYANW